MAVSIKVTRHFSLSDMTRKLVTKADMRDVGLLARERIIARTLRGESASGGGFAPYTEGYAKAKRAALGTSTVNLQVSGNMLNDLQITEISVTADEARVRLGWEK
jgi:hypothetical protein